MADDLWQKALKTLDDETRASLDFNRNTKLDILKKTLKTAGDQKQICLTKRWKFKKGGEEVVVRDVLEKIVRWVEYFKVVGDVAVQYDPIHASLPWAGVRFLLKVLISDTHVFGSAVEGLEKVSYLITRSSIFEDAYLRRKTPNSSALEPALIGVYAEILIYLAKAKKYFQTSTARRVVKSTFLPFEAEGDLQLRKISAQEENLSKMASISDAEVLSRLHDLEKPILRMAHLGAVYSSTLEEKRYKHILNWLSAVDFSAHHRRCREDRLDGSGQWLLDHQQYRDWHASSRSSTFLVHGMPGSGKSMLASAVVDSLMRQASSPTSLSPFAYFYCSKAISEAERQDPVEIMRSIARQLCIVNASQKRIHEAVVHAYERREKDAKAYGFPPPRLSLQECIKVILELTGPNPATLVIDALEEVEAKSRHELVGALHELISCSGSVVKILATSRDDNQITELFRGGSLLRIRKDLNEQDIDAFVRRQIASAITGCRLLGGRDGVSSELEQELTQAVEESAGEVFQLANWQIQYLCNIQHRAGVRQAAQRLSKDTLDSLYADTITQIRAAEPYTHQVASSTFALLLCMREPLSSKAFVEAVSHADMEFGADLEVSDLLRICRNLVVLDQTMDKLRFAHMSVQDFLQTQPEFQEHKTNCLATKACLNSYMYGSPVALDSGLRPTEHFYQYGGLYWGEHCQHANAANDHDLSQIVDEFIFEGAEVSSAFIIWLQDAEGYSNVVSNYLLTFGTLSAVANAQNSPLFAASMFGLVSVLTRSSQLPGFQWNQKNELGQSGLYLASSCGQEAIVRMFLDHGADANATGGRYENPLQAACFEGHLSIAGLLLDHGANPRQRGRFDNALLASMQGCREDLAMLILEEGFEITDQLMYDDLLQLAAQIGHLKVLKHLQKTYFTSFGGSASASRKVAESAISKGQLGVLNAIIRRGHDPEHAVELPEESIAIAALGGHDSTIQLLLGKGLKIEKTGPFGTPLRSASLQGHESTVRLLIKHGANPTGSSSVGNALEAAAMNDNIPTIRLLLHHGVDPNVKGGFYGTALQAAAFRGYLSVAGLLLDAKAEVHAKGIHTDAFHAAAAGGHEDVIQLFLDRGFKLISAPEPRRCAARKRLPNYRNLLREASPTREKCTSPRELAHQLAQDTWADLGILKDNAERGIDEHNCMLTTAAANGHHEVVKLILRMPCDFIPTLETRWFFWVDVHDALLQASIKGHRKVLEALLYRGLDVVPRENLTMYLNNASLNGHLEIVRDLVAHIRDSHSSDNHHPGPGSSDRHSKSTIWEHVRLHWSRTSEDEAQQQQEKEEYYEKEILLPGCRGDHVPIVETAFSLIHRHWPAVRVKKLHADTLYEAVSNSSIKVMRFLFEHVEFDQSSIFKAIRLGCQSGNAGPLGSLFDHHLRKIPESGDPFPNANAYDQAFQNLINIGLVDAARKGHVEATNLLLGVGANANVEVETDFEDERSVISSSSRNPPKNTALRTALNGLEARARYGYQPDDGTVARVAIVFRFLDHDASITLSGDDEETLLEMMIKCCPSEFIREMIDRHSSLLSDASKVMIAWQTAARREIGVAAAMKLILPAPAGQLATYFPGYRSENIAMIHVLETALGFFAPAGVEDVFDGHWSSVPFHGQFVNSESIHTVLYEGPGAAVKLLLKLLPTEQTTGDKYELLMQMAAVVNDLACVRLLLHHGIDVNARSHYYGTVLQCASRFGHLELVKLLLSSGAEVNTLNGRHGTAIRAAVRGGHEDVVNVLIDHGADINLCEEGSEHILRTALSVPSLQILRALILAGADIHSDATDQPSLLVSACELGDYRIVGLLLESNHNVQSPAKKPWTACSYSNESGSGPCKFGSEPAHPPIPDSKNQFWYRDERASALHMACAVGYEEIARTLLQHGADVDLQVEVYGGKYDSWTSDTSVSSRTEEDTWRYLSKTPLQMAAFAGHAPILLSLIEAGASVNHFNYHGTALSIAVRKNKIEAVEALLDSGAIIWNEFFHCNALEEAAALGSRAIVELLLDALPDSVVEDRALSDALCAAASTGDEEICQMILAKGAKGSTLDLSQIHAARPNDNAASPMQYGVSIHDHTHMSQGTLPLHVAAYNNQNTIVKLFLAHGADPNFLAPKHGSPIQAALKGLASHGSHRWISASSMSPSSISPSLVSPPPPISALPFRSPPPPISALPFRSPPPPMSSLPLMQPPPPMLPLPLMPPQSSMYQPHSQTYYEDNSYIHRLLHCEFDKKIISDCECVVQTLLASGGDINTAQKDLRCLLQLASCLGISSIVQMLLRKGTDVNHVTEHLGTALTAASKRGNYQIVELLLKEGADVNLVTESCGTALMAASEGGNYQIVELLLKEGADVNLVTDSFGTALMAALKGGKYQIAKMLLEKGADVNQLDPQLGSALHYSCNKWNASMVQLLLRHGAAAAAVAYPHGSPLSALLAAYPGSSESDGVLIAEMLLRHGHYPRLEQSDILGALKMVSYNGLAREMVDVLLEHDKSLRVGQAILVHAIKTLRAPHVNTLRLLLQREEGLGITPAMLEAVNELEIMKVLLSHRPICRISPETVISVSKGSDKMYGAHGEQRRRLIGLLLDHESSMLINEAFIMVLLGTGEPDRYSHRFDSSPGQNLIEHLLERHNNIRVTQAMLEAAADPEDVKALLKHAPNITVTRNILHQAATTYRSGSPEGIMAPDFIHPRYAQERVRLLLSHDDNVTVDQFVLDALTARDQHYWLFDECWNDTLEYIALLLQRGPDIQLTSSLLKAILDGSRHVDDPLEMMRQYVCLFLKHDKKVGFDDDVRQKIEFSDVVRQDADLMMLLHRLEDVALSFPCDNRLEDVTLPFPCAKLLGDHSADVKAPGTEFFRL